VSGLTAFARRIVADRNLYGALAFAETAESLSLVRAALAPTLGDRVAGVTSSGDVLLMLAAHGAREVVGFDSNGVQTAIAELKRMAMIHLDVPAYRRFFGLDRDEGAARRRIFERLARGPVRRAFPRRHVEAGLLDRGMTYLIIRALTAALARVVDADTMALFLGHRGEDRDRARALDDLLARPVGRRVLVPALARAGAPLRWLFFPHTLCRVSTRPEAMIEAFFDTFRPLFVHGARANPVLSRAATGVLHPEWGEALLSPARFSAVARDPDRVRFETCSIADGLASLPAGWATKVYLSNVPDYLDASGLAALARALHHAAAPGARVLYFSLCDEDRLADHLGPEREESPQIRAQDTVFLYPGIVVRNARAEG
jgi:S-adenosylmethionine:diacylglycerol 3-amino-3-carboxypropyl transferase